LKLLQIDLGLIDNAVDNTDKIVRGLLIDPLVLESLSLTNAGRLAKFSLKMTLSTCIIQHQFLSLSRTDLKIWDGDTLVASWDGIKNSSFVASRLC
jgi:hypothetical protein